MGRRDAKWKKKGIKEKRKTGRGRGRKEWKEKGIVKKRKIERGRGTGSKEWKVKDRGVEESDKRL
jgi:hypothetical protein